MELDDYVCPMDLEVPSALQSSVIQRSRRSAESVRSRLRSNEQDNLQVYDLNFATSCRQMAANKVLT